MSSGDSLSLAEMGRLNLGDDVRSKDRPENSSPTSLPSITKGTPLANSLDELSAIAKLLPEVEHKDSVMDLSKYLDRGEMIDQGGFGEVYKGKWKNLPTSCDEIEMPHVAIKVMRTCRLSDEKQRQKRMKNFRRELYLLQNLAHNHILPLLGTANLNGDENFPVIVSPWMENGTISEYIVKHPNLSRLPFLLDIIDALLYLHCCNPSVVHGDMKAANVLVNRYGQLFVCDFGLSRMTEDVTLWVTTATHAGYTTRWASPELLHGKSGATTASDVYSYAMTCFEILSGQIPFASLSNEGAVIMAVAVKNERPDRELVPDASNQLWDLMTRCWATYANDRPPTKDVADEIKWLLDSNTQDQHDQNGLRISLQMESVAPGALSFSGPTTPFTRSNSAYMRPPSLMIRPKSDMARSKTPGKPCVIFRKERLSPWSASSDAGTAPSNFAIQKIGLPPPPQVFFGRDGELHQLILGILQGIDYRRGGHAAILGGASMGKSSLAIALLHHPEIQPHFSKHIYFVHCEGISTARDLVFCIACCVRIQLPASDPLKYLITFADSLPGNKVIALDDFEGCWFSDDRNAVERVLQSVSGIDSVTLVVSMRGTTPPAPSAVNWNVSVNLGVLPLPAAKEAFLSFAPNYRGHPRLDSLLERVDCMPIAVGLLGALARNGETIDGLQRRLLPERTLLMSAEPEHRPENSEISFRITIDSKAMKDNPNALRLLSVICLLPAGVTRERLPIVTGLHESDIGNAIYVLEMLALIASTGGTLTALAPLRDFIETNYPPHPNDEYMLEHYYTELTNFGKFEVGDARFTELREKLEPETVNLHYILSRLLQKGYGLEDTGRSILSFTQYLYWTAPASDLLETLLSRYSKYLSKLLRAQCLQLYGEVLHLQGKSVEAFDALEQARSGFENVGDSYKTARCMHSIAKLHLVANNCTLARENAKKALEVFDNCRELKECAKCNCTLGEILYMEDECDDALEALYLASDQFVESDDRYGAAQCHLLAGDVLRLAGERKVAVEPLSHARKEFEILGYPLGEAQCYQSLGEIFRLDCNTDEARVQFGKAMSIFKSQGIDLGIAKCKMAFGHICFVLGELDEGEEELRESLAIFKDIGYVHGEADASFALGNVLFGQERHDEATFMFEKAREEYESFGNKSLAYDCTRNIAEVQLATDQAAEAIDPMLEALEFYREVEDDANIAECLRTLGNAFSDTEQFDKAIEALSESKDVFATLEETDDVAVTLGDLAAVYQDFGDYPRALELFGQCQAMFVKLGMDERVDLCDSKLKEVQKLMATVDDDENAE